MSYGVSNVSYNSTYKVIGKHPDGRIFAVRHGNVNGLYVVDKDLNLISTLNTSLINYDGNGLGNGINECVFLKSGTMICWGIYRTTPNVTVIWRSTDNTYSAFEPVFTLPSDITFIEKSVAVSTLDDTIMCCEYTTNPQVGGIWSEPTQLNVWRGTNDGRDWAIVHTRNRVGEDTIRHFHAVRYDPYENLFWITSGDWRGESSIASIKPDGTGYVRVIQANPATSGQQERTTSLAFTNNYIWFGSDSFYNQDHYMARINRATRQLELLDLLPNDCIRLSDKIKHPMGDLLIANKSFENSPNNAGTTQILYCADFERGEWLNLYSWNVKDINTVSIIYQIIDNGDGRIFVYIRRIRDESNTVRDFTTAIIDIANNVKAVSEIGINAASGVLRVPIYNVSDLADARLKIYTGTMQGLKLTDEQNGLRIKLEDGIKSIETI